MSKVLEIGYPMEYEDDKHIIRTGLWLKEYEVELLEKELKENQQLKHNRDTALKKLNKYRNRKDHYGLWCMDYGDNADIIHILKGESDE
jgi:hypothetical protein